MTDMDRLDLQLLYLLKGNSRLPFTELAARLKVSEGTVRGRLRRLLEGGVIQRFTIKTTGAGVKALVNVSIDRNVNTTDISSQVAAIPGVEQVYETAGDFDIAAIVDVGSTLELNEIIEAIRRMADIVSTRTHLILKEVPIGEEWVGPDGSGLDVHPPKHP